MSDQVDRSKRSLLGAAVLSVAFGPLGLAATEVVQAKPMQKLPSSTGHIFGPLKKISAGKLDVAYAEVGPGDGPPVLLLHGWPYDIHTYVDVAPILAAAGYRVLIPYLRGYGETRFLAPETPRNGESVAFASDAIAFLDALRIERAVVGGVDRGGGAANLMAILWPQRCKALVSVSGYLVGSQDAGQVPLPPSAELQWWYLFYFATERGKAGYSKYTKDFNRLIWEQASPQWRFDDATFERSAKAFENPDFVAISLHTYRWRLGLEKTAPEYGELEKKIATFPNISVPTITLEGDANGAPHAPPSAYARKYAGKYEHRNITGGVGHNLPQEAPEAFAKAIIDVDNFV